jgi:hypothetical protein
MFHPDFRPRLQIHIVSIPFEQFKTELRRAGGAQLHATVCNTLDREIAKVEGDAPAVRELGDKLAALLLAAMSGYGAEQLPAGDDPFGLYPTLASVHPAVLQNLYNQILGDDPRDLAPT